ncbi:hypothetical protein ACTJLC_29550 [Paraburkholderia sp. 22099]|uniref:Uncharacterized protein n=1 Tax=Paraburkholderia terricola TaxID=169427 RepID=A0ABU1M1H0_9BURK|nr:hypothetical protein [Paraburkholderia terricola]MDR6412590.1 hypothetical protein [Paraburkholderia terricola]MDR6485010.1 hypothetical protein [Paraburkholderia terricola]
MNSAPTSPYKKLHHTLFCMSIRKLPAEAGSKANDNGPASVGARAKRLRESMRSISRRHAYTVAASTRRPFFSVASAKSQHERGARDQALQDARSNREDRIGNERIGTDEFDRHALQGCGEAVRAAASPLSRTIPCLSSGSF